MENKHQKRIETVLKNTPSIQGTKFPISYPVLFSGGKRIRGRQVRDDLSSQCDGANKTFTLTKQFIANTVQLFSTQFPIVFRPVVDFTENANGTLTLTAEVGAPASGQTLVALYEKYI